MQNKPRNGRPGTGRPQFHKPAEGKRPYGKPEARSNANPRLVAVNVLNDVLQKEAYAAMSLDDRLSSVNLNQLDRRLCASIVYRTLENLYYLDFALSGFLRDADALDMTVRNILRTGACQILLHDRVPNSAAVNEAVKLTRAMNLDGFSGMVNAVLRRLAEHQGEIQWPAENEGAKYLSVMFSMPEWLAQRLIDDYGAEEAARIAAYRTEKHAITVRPTYGKEAEFQAHLAKKVWETEPATFPGALRVYGAMQIARDSDYLGGLFSIQGEGSMVAAAAVDVRRGMNVLDCCAAPGGKTAYMAETMQGTGRVYALDVHPHRVALLEAAVRRLKLDNVRPQLYDATRYKEDWEERFDVCLLDAPCTGLGEWHEKPDIRYGITPESLESLQETQKALLENCAKYVKRGGALVYATCSILPEENEMQLRAFLERHPEYTLEPLPENVAALYPNARRECGLQLLPGPDGDEGFFMARLRRQG